MSLSYESQKGNTVVKTTDARQFKIRRERNTISRHSQGTELLLIRCQLRER